MKKILTIILVIIWIGNSAAQDKNNPNKKRKKDLWTLDLNFGATKLLENEPTYSLLQDNIVVGFDIGATKTFKSSIYVSAGITFSTLKEGPFDLWENLLDYFSANVDLGYKFTSDALTEPYLAIGTSFINAPNTLSNAKSSVSLNLTGGFIFWLRNSNYGIVIQNTYKNVSSDYMVSHNRITVGLRYRL